MSFSGDIKREVALIEPNGQDEALSELSAIIKTSGEISQNRDGRKIIVTTNLTEVCDRVNQILNLLYGKTAQITQNNDLNFAKKQRYQVNFPSDITQDILLNAEIMCFDEDKYLAFNSGISKYLVQEPSTATSYVRGAFISCFSTNISVDEASSKNTGYHAEFVFNGQQLAEDFSLLLADFDIISKIVERKASYIVYIKDIESISDLLALVGATKGVLKLQNESVVRSIRNTVNRQTNCISANLTKTIDASVRETDAINIISETIGLDKLDAPLQEVAFLRLANPEESLDSLVKLSGGKISKSGLYHRLKKLVKIANELK